MPEPLAIEVHKALADDTRYRLYRYLRLSGRPVAVRELAIRLSLHPNTLRPHLRRLEEVGLVAHDSSRTTASVGRPQTVYVAVDVEPREGRDHKLLADILAGLLTTTKQRERAEELARDWGAYLMGRTVQRPGAKRPPGVHLAALQDRDHHLGPGPLHVGVVVRVRRHVGHHLGGALAQGAAAGGPPRRPPGRDGPRRLPASVPADGEAVGPDLAPRVSVPGPARRASRPGVRCAPRPA